MVLHDPDFTEFARSGCEEAFRRLVTRHVAAVHSGALRLLRGRADMAADAVQTVFIQLARRAPSLPRDLVVSAWLHRQTVRSALNILRGETRRAVREKAASDLMHMNTPESSAVDEALRPQIDRAFGRLSSVDQQALTLRFFDGCELREIGERLGMTPGAVQKRLSRATERLRRILGARGICLSAAALTLWLSEHAVQATSAGFAASVALVALPHAGTGGTLLNFLTFMTSLKSLGAGIALGLLTAGTWAVWQGPRNAGGAAMRASSDPDNHEFSRGAKESRESLNVPRAAATPDGLLEQLLAITSAPDNEITRQRFAIWIGSIPENLFDPLLVLADKRLSETERSRWLPELARQWARLNPTKAIPLLACRKEGPRLAADGFRVWHDAAPEAARQWLVGHQDDIRMAKALPGIVTVIAEALAKKSEDVVLRWASNLQGSDLRAAALAPLWKAAAAAETPRGWTSLCQKFLSEEDAEFRIFGLQKTLEKWTQRRKSEGRISTGLTEVDQWFASLPAGPEADKVMEMLMAECVKWRVSERPENTLARLGAQGPQAASEAAARLIAQSKEISPYINDWLLPLLSGRERETAALRAARLVAAGATGNGWSSERPTHAAAIEWALQVSDTSVRDPLIYGIYRQWLQYQDERKQRDFAGAWLERTALPPEIKLLMQKAQEDFHPKSSR